MAKQVFCCALLLISILTFAATAHAVVVDNQLTTKITVYTPPAQCQPCACQEFLGAPCACTAQCILIGMVVAPRSSATVALDEEYYPLAYLRFVEADEFVSYSVKAADLERITVNTTLVATGQACEEAGLVARLLNRSSKQDDLICLVPQPTVLH